MQNQNLKPKTELYIISRMVDVLSVFGSVRRTGEILEVDFDLYTTIIV